MSRIKVNLPENFSFSTKIPVRITDVNYGGHVGNDAVLSILHEVRMQFLKSMHFTELNFGGAALIMSDVGIEFRSEVFYGEVLTAKVAVGEIGRVAFDIFYLITKEVNGSELIVAAAKTGMVCYSYEFKKVIAIPEEAKKKLASHI